MRCTDNAGTLGSSRINPHILTPIFTSICDRVYPGMMGAEAIAGKTSGSHS
eukprot:COSAG01_NODE_41937_length_445_cov_1.783237_1_plen_50_part_10